MYGMSARSVITDERAYMNSVIDIIIDLNASKVERKESTHRCTRWVSSQGPAMLALASPYLVSHETLGFVTDPASVLF